MNEGLLGRLEGHTAFAEGEDRDTAPLGDGELLLGRRLPGVRQRVAVVLTQKEDVGIGALHSGEAGLAGWHRLRRVVLESARLMPERQNHPGQRVALLLEAVANRAQEDVHAGSVPRRPIGTIDL